MTAARRLAKLGALTVAVVIHGALAWAVIPRIEVEVEGGAGAQEVRLGTSFADMAAGALEPVQPAEVTEPTPPPEVARAQDAPRSRTPAPAPETIHARPVAPERAAPVTAERAAPVAPDAADAVPSVAALAPTPPETIAPQPTKPNPPKPAAKPTPPETLSAEPDAPPAPARSLRPERRSPAFEKKHAKAPPPKKTPKKKTAPKSARGNAERDATAGSAQGSDRAKAKSSGNAGRAKASGNAAASNYPGLVMRRIARVPRPRADGRGAAVVAFRINAGGGLAGVSIARSSGSAQLDRAALRMIRRAAPFPPPPAGAQRSFTINIEGR
ncbi:TonB family protein [Roseovarius spongiae]|uniref:TonB family protein n=1 Tax=Roseovarius spongiae TaxID=2320272 RepID=A0A3A8AY32_9RHOB|nr:energy transducer TonB [Roseovarius spongiae]RKF16827.1 TonB family protein [Roseovarius spongiae]